MSISQIVISSRTSASTNSCHGKERQEDILANTLVASRPHVWQEWRRRLAQLAGLRRQPPRDAQGIECTLHRAIGLWYSYPQYCRELQLNGMKCDNSWNHAGKHYLNMYELIRDK